jgi:hypothetical protein
MPKNARKRAAAEVAPAEPLPDWAIKTPEEMRYDLEMYDPWEGCVDGVSLTRNEYLALKQYLAKMRGIVVPKSA